MDRGDCTNDPRSMQLIAPASGAIKLEVMIYRQGLTEHRPLVIFGSIDYPMPPSEAFCERMWAAGLQVIYVRRPGHGGTPGLPPALLSENGIRSGAAAAAEGALLAKLLCELGLRNMVLLSLGSANPVGFRVAGFSGEIGLMICANPVFNQPVLDVIKPAWFQSLLGLIIRTRTGVKLGLAGLKHQIRKDPIKFYKEYLSSSPGDWRYTLDNEHDFREACRLLLNVSADTLSYEVRMSLLPDRLLVDNYFAGKTVVILSGEEGTDTWKCDLKREAERLSLPLVKAPRGDILVPYVSPETLLGVIQANGVTQAA